MRRNRGLTCTGTLDSHAAGTVVSHGRNIHKPPRRRFTDDFKAQAVALSDSVGRSTAARQLGMSVKTLDNWVRAAKAGQPLTSPKRTAATELGKKGVRVEWH